MTTKGPATMNGESLRGDPSWFDFAWRAYYATWERRTVLLIGAMTLVRLLMASATTLSDTESYYVGWARVPSLSYYDHPPLVAWTTWAMEHVSRGAFAVRALPVFCAAIFAFGLKHLATRMFSARAAFIAVAIAMVLPAFAMTSVLVNPEGLLAPLWMAYLIALYELRDRNESWRPLVLGAIVGVAFLAKYTAVLGVPLAFAWVASSKDTRRWLARPSFYAAGLVALAIASPVIAWNHARHWPSLTLHLVERAAPATLATYAHNALGTLASQWTLFHPLVFPGLVAIAALTVRRAKTDARHRFLAWTSLPVLVFFFAMMVRVSDAEPHWTMVGYVPLFIAAGAWADGVVDRAPRVRAYLFASAAFSAALLAVYVVHMRTPALLAAIPPSVYDANADPVNETLGWDDVRAAVVEEAAALGPNAVVASHHNVLCGHLQEALDDVPPVYCASARRTEFDFVGRAVPPRDAPVVFVDSARYPLDPSRALASRDCTLAFHIDVKRGERIVNALRLYACAPAR